MQTRKSLASFSLISEYQQPPSNPSPPDYPDFAEKIGEALRQSRADRGVLICGSGVGASVAANKIPGIRAGLCHDSYSAHQSVEHDDMNVLVVGTRVIGPELARELVRFYLAAIFSREERHNPTGSQGESDRGEVPSERLTASLLSQK